MVKSKLKSRVISLNSASSENKVSVKPLNSSREVPSRLLQNAVKTSINKRLEEGKDDSRGENTAKRPKIAERIGRIEGDRGGRGRGREDVRRGDNRGEREGRGEWIGGGKDDTRADSHFHQRGPQPGFNPMMDPIAMQAMAQQIMMTMMHQSQNQNFGGGMHIGGMGPMGGMPAMGGIGMGGIGGMGMGGMGMAGMQQQQIGFGQGDYEHMGFDNRGRGGGGRLGGRGNYGQPTPYLHPQGKDGGRGGRGGRNGRGHNLTYIAESNTNSASATGAKHAGSIGTKEDASEFVGIHEFGGGRGWGRGGGRGGRFDMGRSGRGRRGGGFAGRTSAGRAPAYGEDGAKIPAHKQWIRPPDTESALAEPR